MFYDIEWELKAIEEEPSLGKIYDVARTYRKKLLDKQAEALRKMKTSYQRNVGPVLEEITRLEDLIEELSFLGQQDNIIFINNYQRMLNILDQLEEGISKYSEESFTITKTGQLQMATIANEATEKITKNVLGKKPKGVPASFSISWQKMDPETLESFVGFTADGSPLVSLFNKIAPEAVEELSNIIEQGIIVGKNPRAVASEIRGVANISKYRAERITRTEMIRANREATRKAYSDNNKIVNGYYRIAIPDQRVCPACLALSGKEYQTSEILPTHPQCRCVMVPKTLTWAEITGIEGLDEEEGKIRNGDDILKEVGDEKARLILGPGRYNLWKDGLSVSRMGTEVFDANWGWQTRVIPIVELNK